MPPQPLVGLADFLKEKGFPQSTIAGIVSNAHWESGGDPGAVGDDGTSVGLHQWHNERATALLDFAKSQGASPKLPAVQYAFLLQELQSDYPDLIAKMAKTTPAKAAMLFQQEFERPKDINPDRGETADHINEWLTKRDRAEKEAAALKAQLPTAAAFTEPGADPVAAFMAMQPGKPALPVGQVLSTPGKVFEGLSNEAMRKEVDSKGFVRTLDEGDNRDELRKFLGAAGSLVAPAVRKSGFVPERPSLSLDAGSRAFKGVLDTEAEAQFKTRVAKLISGTPGWYALPKAEQHDRLDRAHREAVQAAHQVLQMNFHDGRSGLAYAASGRV